MVPGPLSDFGRALTGWTEAFLEENGRPQGLIGLGIGTHGLVDFANKRYVGEEPFTEASDYDLCGGLENASGLPVCIDNDLNATALAEARWGTGRRHDNFVYVNIGTGLAVGIIDEGRLVRGRRNFAGEIGLCLLPPNPVQPVWHNLESVVSGGGLDGEVRRRAKWHPGSVLYEKAWGKEPIHSYTIFEACRAGDALAAEVVDSAATRIAAMLINLEFILDAGLYVFGGGVMSDGDWFLRKMESRILAISGETPEPWEAEMALSDLGSDTAGLLGAASLVFETAAQKEDGA